MLFRSGLKGVKPPEAFGEGSRDWSLGHAGDEGPHLSMTGESRGCSRAAAPVCPEDCLTQGSNACLPSLLHCKRMLYLLNHWGTPKLHPDPRWEKQFHHLVLKFELWLIPILLPLTPSLPTARGFLGQAEVQPPPHKCGACPQPSFPIHSLPCDAGMMSLFSTLG